MSRDLGYDRSRDEREERIELHGDAVREALCEGFYTTSVAAVSQK